MAVASAEIGHKEEHSYAILKQLFLFHEWTSCFSAGLFGTSAGMAELADAADSKSAEGNLVGVRPPLPAPRF